MNGLERASPSSRCERSRAAFQVGAAGAVLCLLAAISCGAVRVAYDVRPAYVHVRWAPSVGEAERPQFRARYGLTAEEAREDESL